jgi:hypothetical protein
MKTVKQTGQPMLHAKGRPKTSEKSNALEVLKPVRPIPNVRAQLDAYIEKKITEIIGADQTGVFEPWFQRKELAREIRKLQTVPQLRKWHNCFNEWGCVDCKKKDGRYGADGMCATCFSKWKMRLQTILRFTEKERPDALLFAPDPTELAQSAPQASAGTDEECPRGLFVAAEIEPVEVETRDYITKAERRARRADTLRQAVEQGLTAREIAEKYDPDFLKNPEAATQRIQVALYRYVPPSVRAQRQHERSTRHEEMWRKARALHEGGLCWRDVARLLDPDFAKSPKAAMARIIRGARQVPLIRDLQDVARKALMRK